MGVVQSIIGDIDGDGHQETVEGTSDSHTIVRRNGTKLWESGPGWIDGWARRPWDIFVAVDATRDGRTDILIANNRDGWTGVLTWRDNALHELWGSPSPLRGPAGQWNRRDGDVFHAITYQGAPAVSIIHPGNDAWHGILAWDGRAMVPVVIEKLQQTTGSALFTMSKDESGLFTFDEPDPRRLSGSSGPLSVRQSQR